METIVRLEGLHADADSTDIEEFFKGFNVSDIQIVRGERGEAFIVFGSDNHAREAIKKTGSWIKNKRILLTLSNKTEMLCAFEVYRKKVVQTLEAAKQQSRKRKVDMLLAQPGSLYVYLSGISQETKEAGIIDFFKSLAVEQIIFCKGRDGSKTGNGFVKFTNVVHANEALKFNKCLLDKQCLSVISASEEQWVNAGGTLEKTSKIREGFTNVIASMHQQQFYIYLLNLPPKVKKSDIRDLLEDPQLEDFNISLLTSSSKGEGFVMFKNESQYQAALLAHGKHLHDYRISILPISKKVMLDIAVSYTISSLPKDMSTVPCPQRCVHMKNLSRGVTKQHIQEFFDGFPIEEYDIFLKYDKSGYFSGEALVRFPTEKVSVCAARLNKEWFMGTEVLLNNITEDQIKAFIGDASHEPTFAKH
ncbi:RNA binding motif protein 12B gene 1 [Xenopus tropicalis]|uniref:RNA binding motif protein 12 n=1 Tax=Xenopus tropicalis TaxID=8364 RepID=Q28D32_XENTR|nr:RNA binding motif protein 12B gene 1 [Xenopus tropicalis]AAI57516.1 RNA binding motif protein 12 [Xenopus tropicalis]CAJ83545.1 RNA binding motif protein 12 [Xenopus tropicalis]|eukprot:XP_012820295.1 PREDICTED: RNA binding motif protein 12 isoform X1 [Xenopus tropicalis]